MTLEDIGGVGESTITLPSLRHVMGIDWRDEARCAKMPKEIFFDYNNIKHKKKEREQRTRTAKAVCRICPVKEKCYEFAVRNNEQYGIWAGTLPDERRRLYDILRKTGILESLPAF